MALPLHVWDLSSPTRNETCAPCIGRAELTVGLPEKSYILVLQLWIFKEDLVNQKGSVSLFSGVETTEFSSFREVRLLMFSVASLFTYRAVSQSILLLALLFVPPSLWVCWQQLALVSLRHCVHPSTGAGQLRLGRSAAVFTPSPGPAMGLWRQLKPWSMPALTCICPQSPTAAQARSVPAARALVVVSDVS